MRASVALYGVVRHVVKAPQTIVDLPPAFTLGDVVDAVVARHGPALRDVILGTEGRLHTYVRVFVGGEETAGDLTERFGPFDAGAPTLEILVLPVNEGGAA
jgi:hypothetical protein